LRALEQKADLMLPADLALFPLCSRRALLAGADIDRLSTGIPFSSLAALASPCAALWHSYAIKQEAATT
jgi:hypothetical protein